MWTSNTAHLRDERTRYSGLHDIPPDSQRRPIGDAALCDLLCIPRDIQDRYVQALIEQGAMERRGDGLVVPAAVFTRPEMLAGTNEIYSRLIEMLARLRKAGFAVGPEDPPQG